MFNGGSHNNHAYPADKMIPIGVLKNWKKQKIGNKDIKHIHNKKCRQYHKEICHRIMVIEEEDCGNDKGPICKPDKKTVGVDPVDV